ncbi:MAG: hypothetical protein SFT92_02070 [Rickettsiales bacterium]|nr:hypothetical protein [Rickettsiales bacterium]
MDALSKPKKSEDQYHKDEAVRWLLSGTRDFVEVCLNAGLDPAYVRRKAKKALLQPTAWRAAPGKGKRYVERKAYRLQLAKRKANKAPINVTIHHSVETVCEFV